MGKLEDFLSGIRILEEIDSPINGKVKVVKSIAWGTYFQVADLTQSGGILKGVWNKSLKKLSSRKDDINNCLVIGLGGGTVVGLVKKYWPNASVLGVDIDPIMVELGRKYLNMENVEVVIGDGFDFVKKENKSGSKYDLVLTDTYIGDSYPEKFESSSYISLVKKSLTKGGVAIFNRLYYDE